MMRHIKIKASSIKLRTYGLVADAIFDAILPGLYKWQKYNDRPGLTEKDMHEIRDQVCGYIMLGLEDVIDWDA